jgi:hypothetical protein
MESGRPAVTTWKIAAATATAALMLLPAGCENGTDAPSETDSRGRATSLSCKNSIESLDGPTVDSGHTVVLGRVALPTGRALGANRTAEDPEFPLLAKDGLVIKAGTAFELIVPEVWRDRLRIGWGSPAQPRLVSRCRAVRQRIHRSSGLHTRVDTS